MRRLLFVLLACGMAMGQATISGTAKMSGTALLGINAPPLITAPTVTSHNSTVYNTTGLSKTVTPAGWSTGDIVVVVAVDEGGSNEVFATPTATGLTFSAIINHQAASNPALILSAATAGSTCSASCVVTQTINNSGFNWGMTVYVITGSSGLGNSASQFNATRTVSLTPTQADSLIVWGVGDWAAGAVQSMTPTPTNADVGVQVGTNYSAYVGELTDQTSAGAVSYGILGSGTGPFSIGVLEVTGH